MGLALSKLRVMSFDIAYLSGGKLHLKQGNAAVRTVDSEFAEAAKNTRRQMQRRDAWKRSTAEMASMTPLSTRQDEETNLPIKLTDICAGQEGTLFYALSSDEMGGIFSFDTHQNKEKRLFHSAEFTVQHLNYNPAESLVACCVAYPSGESNIATMKADGIRPQELTSGDSVDLAPAWVPGKKQALVFQSAGIARNDDGAMLAQGPFCIEQLDLEAKTVDTLAEDPNWDYLAPQLTTDGTLYYIRRPYKAIKPLGIFQILKDILLMPFRLAYAIFEFLNAFTRMFTGKGLAKPSKPQAQGSGNALIWGQPINTNEEAKRNQRFDDEDSPALVPRSWELIRQRPGQDAEAIARGILAFHVAAGDRLIYTNGSAIYGIIPGGVAKRLVKGKLIEQVALISSGN